MTKNKVFTNTTLITFGVFMTEAIFHYNMGVQANGDKKGFQLPPPHDLAKLAAVVALFSFANGFIINQLSK